MTLKELIALLTPFALAMRWELDAPTFRAYHRQLAHIPAKLFDAALEKAGRQPRRFPPTAPELAALAEEVRLEWRASLQWVPCALCSAQGWVEREVEGITRAVRCDCWKAHQARVAELDVPAQPVALIESVPEGQ